MQCAIAKLRGCEPSRAGPLARCLLESSAALATALKQGAASEVAGACEGPLLPEDAVWLRWFRSAFDASRSGDTAADIQHQRSSALHPVPSPPGSDIRSFFARASAATSAPDIASDIDGEVEVDIPPPPALGAGRKRRRLRPVHSKWRCDECGFLAVGKYWSINKRLHIMRWHPDMRAMLSLRRPVGLLPWTPACIWKCRYCDKGQGTEGSSDSRLHARLHHREQCHPDKPRAHFLLVRANNAPVATKAVRNKGAASHLMRLKKGEAGEHDPIRVATPPTGKAKKNRVLYRVLCRKCGAYAARLKDIANAPCRLFANKGPQRKKLVERLTAALERTDLSEEVRDNTMRAVEVIKQINQQAVVAEPREHRLEAIAWPIGGFSVRFLCSLCRRIHVNTGAFRNQPCVGEAWSQYSKGQLAKLRALASEGGTAGNTASALLRHLQPEAGVQEP